MGIHFGSDSSGPQAARSPTHKRRMPRRRRPAMAETFLPSSRRTIWRRGIDLDGNLLWYPRTCSQEFSSPGQSTSAWRRRAARRGQHGHRAKRKPGRSLCRRHRHRLDGTTQPGILDRERAAGWTSPALLQEAKHPTAVLIQSSNSISAHRSGHGRRCCGPIAQDCRDDFVGLRRRRARVRARQGNDRPAGGGSAEANARRHLENNQVQAGAASPTVTSNRVYVVNRGGVLIAADASDGKILSRTRLEGNCWGTPVMAGNRLFAVSFEGLGQLVEMSADGRSGKVTAKIPFGEAIQASPVVANGAVFVRGDGHLWKLVAPEITARSCRPARHSDPS